MDPKFRSQLLDIFILSPFHSAILKHNEALKGEEIEKTTTMTEPPTRRSPRGVSITTYD